MRIESTRRSLAIRRTVAMGPQRPSSLLVSTTSSFSEIDYGGHNQTVRYDGILGSRWVLEGAYARALNTISELPSVDEWRVADQTVSPLRLSGGVGFYEAGNRSLNNQWSIKSTNVVADHQIRYGLAYDDVAYTNLNQRTGPTFVAPDGRTTATGAPISILPDPVFGRIYRVTRANFNSGRETAQRYFNCFRAGLMGGDQPADHQSRASGTSRRRWTASR